MTKARAERFFIYKKILVEVIYSMDYHSCIILYFGFKILVFKDYPAIKFVVVPLHMYLYGHIFYLSKNEVILPNSNPLY